MNSEKIKSVTDEIIAACPFLREASWVDGRLVQIVKDENEDSALEFVHA